MKYIKTYESLNTLKVGDYIKTVDLYNIEHDKPIAMWNNQYGIIKNIGYRAKSHSLYLIHYTYNLRDELKEFILRKSNIETLDFNKLETDYKKEKYDQWFCDDYLIKVSKEEFDNGIQKIEAETSANKYNL